MHIRNSYLAFYTIRENGNEKEKINSNNHECREKY